MKSDNHCIIKVVYFAQIVFKKACFLIFYLLDCFINVYTYPNPKPTPYNNEKIVIIVVHCDKNYAVLMCACPVVPYVSLVALFVSECWLFLWQTGLLTAAAVTRWLYQLAIGSFAQKAGLHSIERPYWPVHFSPFKTIQVKCFVYSVVFDDTTVLLMCFLLPKLNTGHFYSVLLFSPSSSVLEL